MATQGGIIEQKTIGLQIDKTGTFINTELVNDNIQLKQAEEGIYYEEGGWISSIVDIGDNFQSYGKLFIAQVNTNDSKIITMTKTSSDGINFNQWETVLEDGTIKSEKKRFIQVQIKLFAGVEGKEYLLSLDELINDYTETVVTQIGGYATPTLTSNISSAGELAFASSAWNNDYLAWKAFDKSNSYYYSTASGQVAGFLGFKFNKEKVISKYMVRSISNASLLYTMPKSWILQASNNTTNGSDGDWDDLDIQVNQTWSTINTNKEYSIENSSKYISYRIKWSENNAGNQYSTVGELDFYEKEKTAISLKRNYSFDMSLDESWSDIGSLHRYKVSRNEWTRIDKMDVMRGDK